MRPPKPVFTTYDTTTSTEQPFADKVIDETYANPHALSTLTLIDSFNLLTIELNKVMDETF